ncbi:MAG: YajQ family cyclic di-GMP-binding protein [Candidatus Margulisbacteria bacterium]|nr:YajQ family cyclic di-GMP-binding protein [Candidatus Margulisiibacteriota bacterium]
MASEHSFDIVSNVDMQEVSNAIQQALKEINQRYDLKDSDSEIDLMPADKILILKSGDDYKCQAVLDILKNKLIGRGISVKSLEEGEVKEALGGTVKQEITIQQGIPQDKAKQIGKDIRESGYKVKSQIQGDQIRVTAKKIDDLQAIISLIKEKEYPIHLETINFR